MIKAAATVLVLVAAFAAPIYAQEAAPPLGAQKAPSITEKFTNAVKTVTGDPVSKADYDMRRVLDAHAELNPKPIDELSAGEARKQPTPADAVKALLQKEGKPEGPPPGVTAKDITYPGAAGELPARVYTPEGAAGPLPVVLYFHGGGFVIADIDTYDAAPRALAKLANAVVVSAHYRQAPENKFPAAHDDAKSAYKWLLAKAGELGGDPKRVAVMGESAGGNLAINVAIAARDEGLQAPVHQVLIYPVAGTNMDAPSYKENEGAKPLNKPMMAWFVDKYLGGTEGLTSPAIDLVGKANLAKLPATTIVTAQIDPLRSEGEELAKKLKVSGVDVEHRNFEGAAHEFFGMAAVVKDAAEAQTFVAKRLAPSLGAAGQ
jgi:acetyl esterase